MNEKTFNFSGNSFFDGAYGMRFTNDLNRIKALAKHGHKDIVFLEMEHAMAKADCVTFIESLEDNDEAMIAAIKNWNSKIVVKSSKTPKTSKTSLNKAVSANGTVSYTMNSSTDTPKFNDAIKLMALKTTLVGFDNEDDLDDINAELEMELEIEPNIEFDDTDDLNDEFDMIEEFETVDDLD